MEKSLTIEGNNDLKLSENNEFPSQSAPIRFIARVLSYLFHPAFVPLYAVWFLLFVHPYAFAGFSTFDKSKVLIQAFVMFSFFPIITVLLLKGLKFINSIQLHTQKDRIIPLIACGIWYFWIWYVWRNLPDYPKVAVLFTLGCWISVSLALMANIIMKISLHSIAMGVVVAFMFLLGFNEQNNLGLYIAIALLATGLVCTSRFIVSNHSAKEIYGGLALGILSMVVAWVVG